MKRKVQSLSQYTLFSSIGVRSAVMCHRQDIESIAREKYGTC